MQLTFSMHDYQVHVAKVLLWLVANVLSWLHNIYNVFNQLPSFVQIKYVIIFSFLNSY